MGFSYEKWETDPNSLASWLINFLETWEMEHFETSGVFKVALSPVIKKKYGEVRAAIQAIQNDIHNLAIGYHQMDYILRCVETEDGLKILYLGNLTESYIINVRSIYDFMAVFARLAASIDKIGQGNVSTDALTTLLKGIKTSKERGIKFFSEQVIMAYSAMETSLQVVKLIRDAIVHHGKDSIITLKDGTPYFRIPKNINRPYETLLPDILGLKLQDYPLFPYLHRISIDLFEHMHNLGVALANDAYYKNDSYKTQLPVLVGICIPKFLTFLNSDFKSLKGS